ncbi:MAG: class I SAM-dependent methyltransferase [Alphaproteobacteria bacterium]|nr:class I SAM-dependent methyltransferase [Alphaproteobacteria bacterium]
MDLLNTILIWVFVWLWLWNAYILVFNKGVPNIRTAPAIRNKILEILQKDYEARGAPPYTVIDLGSGNGWLTRKIARALPEVRVIGIEISGLAWRWSMIFRKISGLRNLTYIRQDFLTCDLGEADAVVLFLTAYDMGRVGTKLNRDLKPGTLVISNKFALGDGWRTDSSLDVKTLYPHQKKLHIYYKA